MTNPPPEAALDTLRTRVTGRVIAHDEPGFDAIAAVAYGGGRRPAAVVRVANAPDVAAVVTWARETGTELAVRCGGHSSAGHGTTDGGVVIDLRDLNGIDIDPVGRTAWAGAGLTAGEVTRATAAHGLAIGFGDTGSVGIGGLTTAGGVGFLVRKHGLTIDNLLAAEIVTADGRIRIVDAATDPDLFWAVRGAGANIGVATRFRYRLAPVPGVVGGLLLLPATAEVLAGFIAAAEAAPDELSTIVNVMPAPPLPFVREEHHGKVVLMTLIAYAGDEDAGLRAVAPFRALATPLVDMLRPMTYPELFPPDAPPPPADAAAPAPAPSAYGRTLFMDQVDPVVAGDIIDRVTAQAAVPGTIFSVVQLRVLGGACGRVAEDATAYAHRASRIMANVAAVHLPTADAAAQRAWVDGSVAALRQSDHGAYVNFLADEGQAGVEAAYPEPALARLRAIKQAVDPDNLFRRNHNITPAG